MMEPDIRIRTNDLGFCYTHFSMMAARHNRLQLALMLDSHLAQLQKRIFGEGKPARCVRQTVNVCTKLPASRKLATSANRWSAVCSIC